jgi:copper chaperone CopZ
MNMFRRSFIRRIALAGSGAVTALVNSAAAAGAHKTVTYRIKGFSCITCAVGLDTMLSRQRGVVRSKSSYAEARAVIEFDPALISEDSLKKFIAEMGFVAAAEGKA